jgi:predicted GNAT superfamily acetyltransferase
MDLEIRQLRQADEFQEVLGLQERIWGLEPQNAMSPLTINNLAMPVPEVGVVLGGYVDGSMIGFQVLIPTLEPGLIFGHMFGLLAPYRDAGLGHEFHLGMIDHLRAKGLKQVCWTFDPLEGRNAHSYLNKLGGTASHYIVNHYAEYCERFKGMPQDRLLFLLDLAKQPPTAPLREPLDTALSAHPVATASHLPNADTVLVQIPGNLQELRKNRPGRALAIRMDTRGIFLEYINNRGLVADRLYSDSSNGERRNYYRLRKMADEKLPRIIHRTAA